jgi:hypothetical protein
MMSLLRKVLCMFWEKSLPSRVAMRTSKPNLLLVIPQ